MTGDQLILTLIVLGVMFVLVLVVVYTCGSNYCRDCCCNCRSSIHQTV